MSGVPPLVPIAYPPPVADRVAAMRRSDLARLLGVSVHTLHRWQRELEFPHGIQVGQTVLFRLIEVEDWIRTHGYRTKVQIPAALREAIERCGSRRKERAEAVGA